MSNSTRICKVCGSEYPYCKTELHNNIFRWQDVACSPEHASIYFAKIEESRKKTSNVNTDNADDVLDVIDDDEDDLDEDLFDEDDEEEDDDEDDEDEDY